MKYYLFRRRNEERKILLWIKKQFDNRHDYKKMIKTNFNNDYDDYDDYDYDDYDFF
jgi:hypothetical protein